MVPSAASWLASTRTRSRPVQSIAYIKDRLVLHPLALGIEVVLAGNDRRSDAADRKQFGQPLVDGVAPGQRIEQRARVGHLVRNPLLRLRRIAILQPAIVVDDFGAVIDIDRGLDLSLRRRSWNG